MLKKTSLILIRIYQKILSPDHGLIHYIFKTKVCRFQPSCSEYTFEAIKKYGIYYGAWRGLKRIGRCQPWRPGGYDPI